MKRRKKQPSTPGQLCLFDVPVTRQQEENQRKTKIKPVEALKSSGLTLIPPAPVKAFKMPQNGLKMGIADRDELRRQWKAIPEAPGIFCQMAKTTPAVLTHGFPNL